MDKRKAGVLLPVSALMSEYGIGDFGVNAKFLLIISEKLALKFVSFTNNNNRGR